MKKLFLKILFLTLPALALSLLGEAQQIAVTIRSLDEAAGMYNASIVARRQVYYMDSTAQEEFKKKYKKEKYKRYKGSITQVDSNKFKINSRIVEIQDSPKEFFDMFTSGIIPPKKYLGILFDSNNDPAKWAIPLNMFTSGPIKIKDIREVKKTENDPNVKRFRCTVFPFRTKQGTVFLFELTSKAGTIYKTTQEFIKHSTLTYLGCGWVYM